MNLVYLAQMPLSFQMCTEEQVKLHQKRYSIATLDLRLHAFFIAASLQGTIVSRFVVHCPGAEFHPLTCEHDPCSVAAAASEEQSPQFDEDGDVIVPRSSSQHNTQSNIVLHIGMY